MVIGWNGTHQIFKELIEKVKPKTIIEVGSWHGQSAITMAKVVKELGLDTKIYCVDTWLGALEFMDAKNDDTRDLHKKDGYPQVYYKFLQNIRDNNVDDIIIPVPQTSRIASMWFKEHKATAELIYIDASHEYEDVKDDIINYLPLCTGVMFGDDFNNNQFPGVKQAVKEVLGEIEGGNFWVYNTNK